MIHFTLSSFSLFFFTEQSLLKQNEVLVETFAIRRRRTTQHIQDYYKLSLNTAIRRGVEVEEWSKMSAPLFMKSGAETEREGLLKWARKKRRRKKSCSSSGGSCMRSIYFSECITHNILLKRRAALFFRSFTHLTWRDSTGLLFIHQVFPTRHRHTVWFCSLARRLFSFPFFLFFIQRPSSIDDDGMMVILAMHVDKGEKKHVYWRIQKKRRWWWWRWWWWQWFLFISLSCAISQLALFLLLYTLRSLFFSLETFIHSVIHACPRKLVFKGNWMKSGSTLPQTGKK